MPDVSADGPWSALVPVKRLAVAKSRVALAPDARRALALAMACDTVRAALASAAVTAVVVVTSDDRAAGALRALGAQIIGDEPEAGLNAALHHGRSAAPTSAVVALSADLPALRPHDLDDVLSRAIRHPATVVSDVSGTGTTMLTALDEEHFRPAFGSGSLAAHRSAGALDLSAVAGQSLRIDVDTLAALRDAAALGLGPDTAPIFAAIDDQQPQRPPQ
jgi:2-phospho-L-lactate/phosphoenolpyruvate guanylyltransferase